MIEDSNMGSRTGRRDSLHFGINSPPGASRKLGVCCGSFITSLSPTPLRRTRSASPVPPHRSPVVLDGARQLLVRRSWQRGVKARIGNMVYSHLVIRSPQARALFASCKSQPSSSAERHARHFVDLLNCTVENLHDMDLALAPWLALVGRGHSGFAIGRDVWDAFGQAIVDAATDWIGPGRGNRETIKAWMVLASFLADRLGVGCDQANSGRSRSPSHNGSPTAPARLDLLALELPATPAHKFTPASPSSTTPSNSKCPS
uniref:Globin family profile domain-containing protein n=1 Tax=Plectus sambesii TaxID=2011161 RepID=A0A914XMF1_9BILA